MIKLKTLIYTSIACCSLMMPLAHADYVSSVLQDTPLVYYRFEETSGTSLANAGSLGNTHDAGTLGGVSLGVTGPIISEPSNSALGLNGSDAYARANAAIASADFGSDGSYSIEMWFKENINHTGDLLALTSNPGAQHGVLVEALGGNGGLRYLHRSPVGNSGGWNINPSAQTYTTGVGAVWHHLVLVNNGGAMSLYLDGVVDSVTATAVNPIDFDVDITIGRLGVSNSLRYYNGNIDELAFYDQALGADRIQAHFAAASIPEPSSFALLSLGLIALWRGAAVTRRSCR